MRNVRRIFSSGQMLTVIKTYFLYTTKNNRNYDL